MANERNGHPQDELVLALHPVEEVPVAAEHPKLVLTGPDARLTRPILESAAIASKSVLNLVNELVIRDVRRDTDGLVERERCQQVEAGRQWSER